MGFSLRSQKLLAVAARPGGVNNQPTRFSLTHRPTIQHRHIQSGFHVVKRLVEMPYSYVA